MGFFRKRLLGCYLQPKTKEDVPWEFSEEELDERGMQDLEETLAAHSGFIVLKGERLRKKEERNGQLAEIFRKTAIVPTDRPMPLESKRTNMAALMHAPEAVDSTGAGPSRSLDSAQDFPSPRSSRSGHEYHSASSRSSSAPPLENPEAENAGEGIVLHASAITDSPMFTAKEQQQLKQQLRQELESEGSGDEEIPAAVLSSSVHGDSAQPDTATTLDTLPLSEMYDWNRFRPVMAFHDYQSPLPMKVSAFIDMQTQKVARSQEDDADRSPKPRTPERDLSTTDGLVFSVHSLDLPMMQLHSRQPSSSRTVSPDVDSDGGEAVLSRLRENKMIRDRQFRASRVSISPNFPVNVWDDVAPTRLHAHLINVSMDQDHNLLPVMN